MKVSAAFFALLLSPLSAFAISHYSAPDSTCSSLQHAIQREGKAVIYTKPEIYFLAVRGIEECMIGEMLSPSYTKTKNNPKCMLLTCKGR